MLYRTSRDARWTSEKTTPCQIKAHDVKAHNVAIEVAQHFEKIVVKSVFGEVCFRSDCRCDIINEVAVEDSSSSRLLWQLEGR